MLRSGGRDLRLFPDRLDLALPRAVPIGIVAAAKRTISCPNRQVCDRLHGGPTAKKLAVFCRETTQLAVRPKGANHQWRKIPPRKLSIDLEADDRLGWVTGTAGAS